MKMNKISKIIVPTLALAMGAALVGSVSSTLAWYQYSTKAQAAYIGTSVGETENLEIKTFDNQNNPVWKSNLKSTDVDALTNGTGTNVLPITPALTAASASFANNAALPEHFFNSVNRGVAGFDTYGTRYADSTNYVQFKLNIRYNNTALGNNTAKYEQKVLKLVDLTIVDTAGENDGVGDLYKAVRVHISVPSANNSSNNFLFARDSQEPIEVSDQNAARANVDTATSGTLDTDNDGHMDTEWGYEWETKGEVVYGVENSQQSAINAAYGTLNKQLGYLPSSTEGDTHYSATAANGLELTVTIWIEGWQKLSGVPTGNAEVAAASSAMWDPATYVNKEFKVGLRFSAEDIPAQNP